MAIELEPTRARQEDLRRLYLLAALVDEGAEARGSLSVKDAADSIKVMFPQAKSMAGKDIEALKEDGLVSPVDDSFATGPSNPQTYVLDQGVTVIEELRQLLEESLDDRAAVLAPLILRYMIKNSTKVPSTSTPTLRKVGFTLLGEPLPDDSVEETLHELKQHGLIEASTGHQQGPIKAVDVTAEGRDRYRVGRPVFWPVQASAASSSVYNTTNNIGQVRSQNVVVGSQGQVQQTANLEVSRMADDLYRAVEQLQKALAEHPDEQHKADNLLQDLDQVKQSEDKSKLTIVAENLRDFSKHLMEKATVTNEVAQLFLLAQEVIKALPS